MTEQWTEEKYLEILTKCKKCGEYFAHSQSGKCPHKFYNKVTQLVAEGKWEGAEKEARKDKK